MKTRQTILGLLVAIQFLAHPGFAGEKNDTILKVLKHSSERSTLFVEENTFVFNLNGYACQWPGLRVLNMVAQQELNHNKHNRMGSDESYLAIGIKDPNMHFCHHIGDAETVFGKELVAGAELPIKITRVLDSRQGKRMGPDGNLTMVRLIHETITIKINGRTIESTAEINLGK